MVCDLRLKLAELHCHSVTENVTEKSEIFCSNFSATTLDCVQKWTAPLYLLQNKKLYSTFWIAVAVKNGCKKFLK